MDNPSFEDILSVRMDDIERPRPLPQGDYVCIIKDRPILDRSTNKETPYVQFTLRPLEALKNVDQKDLDRALRAANGEKKNLSDMGIRATFYLTESALFRLKKFLLEDLQIPNEDNKPANELIDATYGCQCVATVKHAANNRDGTIYADLVRTGPVEAPKDKKQRR